jgi:hypothetical protein
METGSEWTSSLTLLASEKTVEVWPLGQDAALVKGRIL